MKSDARHAYAEAIHDRICVHCRHADAQGECTRPRGSQCALTIHVGPVVRAILRAGPGRTPTDYRRSLAAEMCPVCPRDETEFCSLYDLAEGATDERIEEVAAVVLDVAQGDTTR